GGDPGGRLGAAPVPTGTDDRRRAGQRTGGHGLGVTPATMKLTILAFSGFIAATAGVLWADAWQNLSLSQFNPDLSLSILAVPVIGGLGSLSGAVAGSVLLYMPTFFIAPLLTSIFGSVGRQVGFQLLLGGGAQVALLLSYPTGLAGAAQK